MEIEHLDPLEVLERERQLELEDLWKLEQQLKNMEKEKIRLLQNEHISEAKLHYNSGLHSIDLEELESLYDQK